MRQLRLVSRQRQKLVGQCSAEKNRLHKILTDAGIRLNVVVSDIHGQAARAMIKSLIDGRPLHQASLRSRERFWDIRVPKIDSIFDNSLVPRPSWSPGVPPQHRKLVAATHRSPI